MDQIDDCARLRADYAALQRQYAEVVRLVRVCQAERDQARWDYRQAGEEAGRNLVRAEAAEASLAMLRASH